MTKLEAAEQLVGRGHRRRRRATTVRTRSSSIPTSRAGNMLVEMERTDGVEQPGADPGQPGEAVEGRRGPGVARPPWLGEHTRAVLPDELGLDDAEVDALVADGVVTD